MSAQLDPDVENAIRRRVKADDVVWVADYTVRKRQRKAFEKDENTKARYGWLPTPWFPSEREARAHMVAKARLKVTQAERVLKTARAAMLRAEQKLAGVKE